MKKLLVIAIVLLAFLVTFGCSLTKTYSYNVGGICVEVVTSDRDVIRAAEYAGYTQSACPSTGIVGICADYTTIGGTSFSAYFYSSSYTAGDAELTCEAISGTWTAN